MIRKTKRSNSWAFDDYVISVESSSMMIKLSVMRSVGNDNYSSDFIYIHSDHLEEIIEALQEARAMIRKYKDDSSL